MITKRFSGPKPSSWPFTPIPPPQRRFYQGMLISIMGWILAFLCLASIIIWPAIFFLHLSETNFALDWGYGILALLASALAIYFGPVGFRLVEKGMQMRVKDGLSALKADPRRPVLYLRSFDDDDVDDPNPPANGYTLRRRYYEEGFVNALRSLGPVISIGKPNEPLPQIGTARLYVSDEEWRTAVDFFLSQAAAVVILVGKTPGIWWEIEYALKAVPPERLLFFFPYIEETKTRQALTILRMANLILFKTLYPISAEKLQLMEADRIGRYALFRTRVAESLRVCLPKTIGPVQFVDFQPDGTPRLIPTITSWQKWWLRFLIIGKGNVTWIDLKPTLEPFVAKLAVLDLG